MVVRRVPQGRLLDWHISQLSSLSAGTVGAGFVLQAHLVQSSVWGRAVQAV